MPETTANPFFSVITPSWNQGDFLATCVDSVLAQKDTGFEHLVFDNCSDDATRQVAARYPHLRFFSEADRGQSHAVNKGLQAARGEVICWLNADDAYPEDLFPRLRECFAARDCNVVFGDVDQVSYNGRPTQRAEASFDDRLDLVRWWSSRARLHQPAVFFRRAAAQAAGLLREDLHYAMDYEYWWRMSRQNQFRRVPSVLAVQHRQPDSKTIRSWHKVYKEREKIFAPFYGEIDGGDRRALMREKRRAMALRYTRNASAAAPAQPSAALADLRRALREDWRFVCHAEWLGALRRCL